MGSGAEKKAGSGRKNTKFVMSQVQCMLCCSLALEDTSFEENHKTWVTERNSFAQILHLAVVVYH